MATAREIHRHMKSVGNIGKISKAMKMVAAARLRRAQERAAAHHPKTIKNKKFKYIVNNETNNIT